MTSQCIIENAFNLTVYFGCFMFCCVPLPPNYFSKYFDIISFWIQISQNVWYVNLFYFWNLVYVSFRITQVKFYFLAIDWFFWNDWNKMFIVIVESFPEIFCKSWLHCKTFITFPQILFMPVPPTTISLHKALHCYLDRPVQGTGVKLHTWLLQLGQQYQAQNGKQATRGWHARWLQYQVQSCLNTYGRVSSLVITTVWSSFESDIRKIADPGKEFQGLR